jgi:hypothetical protein
VKTAASAGEDIVKERSVTHATFVIERSYPTTPERAFAAETFEMDFRVGGSDRSTFRAQGVT